jgi:1-acyl-sn-glycerol-3-phosphate acyltransferase
MKMLRGALRGVLFVTWTFAAGAGWLCFRPFLGRAHRATGGAWTLHLWSRGLCRLLGIRVAVSGRACRGPSLRVGNHRGYLDVIVLASVSPALFVSKDDLAGWPVLGFLGKSVGTLFLDRTRPRAVAEVGAGMADLFARGQSVIVFPEGTTTAGDAPSPFHSSLFEPALRAQVPVQPVALSFDARGSKDSPNLASWTGDATFLPHLWRLFCSGGLVAHLTFREPLSGFTDRRAAADAARVWITESLSGRGKPAAHGLGNGADLVGGVPHELRRMGDRHRAPGFAQKRQIVRRVADGHGT